MDDTEITKWSDLLKVLEGFKGKWLFRGDADNVLKTGLERALDAWPTPRPDPMQTERRLVADFRRRYSAMHDYARPASEDTLAWLALMQHYGAPTRLLDCTYSPYIAVYFALSKLLRSGDHTRKAYVWAFPATWFLQVHSLLPSTAERSLLDSVANNHDGVAFHKLFLRQEPIQFVYPVNPLHLNERLVRQQGVFLCPGDITVPFDTNQNIMDQSTEISPIVLSYAFIREGLYELLRMNIDSAILFPGLQGYAESSRTRIAFLENG